LLPEKSFKGVEPGGDGFRVGAYGTQAEGHAAFAAMVTILDEQVGEVLTKLKELGLDKNTMVIFTSDNGPHKEAGADPDYFDSNGPFKGYKRDLYEGGIREPMIAWWPEKITSGSNTDHLSAFWDVMPTVAELAGVKTLEKVDGISFLPTLLGKKGQKQHEYLYWEFHELGGRLALRKGDWKLVKYNIQKPDKTTIELYNLAIDLGEENNVAVSNPELVKELSLLMNSARTESDIFTISLPTNIWKK
jgi:arylsulfatase A-like enzyme